MGVIRRRNPWRIVRALAFGLVMTAVMVAVPVGAMDVDSWWPPGGAVAVRGVPGYMGDLTPPFTRATLAGSRGIATRSGASHGFGFGFDHLRYEFGRADLAWDPQVHGDVPPAVTIHRRRFGWPWRAVAWDDYACTPPPRAGVAALRAFQAEARVRSGLHRGLDYPRWLPAVTRSPYRRLPTVPLWPGLLGNVAVFTLAWYGTGAAVRHARLWRRRRRGRCLWCGYDLRGSSSCPECGSGAPAASSASG